MPYGTYQTGPRRRTRRRRTAAGTGVASVVALVLCCAGGTAFEYAKAHYHDHVATCTVTGKDRGYDPQSGSSKYRVYTQQCGTLGNSDQLLFGKFASGDIQGRLVDGHTYRLRIAGWRQPLLSEFPNIVSVEGEVTAAK